MRKWLIILAFLPVVGFGQNYYFSSSSGDDSNDGTSKVQAWQSMYQFRRLIDTLTVCDSILFEAGSKWDTCRIRMFNLSDIYFGSYGTGDKPKFTGSIDISNTFTQNSNYWSVTNTAFNNDDSEIKVTEGLYVDDVWYLVGRYPDYPMLATSESGDYGYLVDNDASWIINEWVGALVARADIPYGWDSRKVTSNSDNRLNFSSMSEDADVMNYILYNDSSALNLPYEWSYNSTSQRLLVYSTEDLNSKTVDFVIDTFVFYIDGCSDLTFDGLDIGRSNRNVIHGDAWQDIVFTNCDIHNAGNFLVFVYYNSGGDGIEFTNCELYNAHGGGIVIGACGFTINNNYFHNFCFYPGLVTTPYNDFTLGCIENQWSHGEISYNRFDSIVIANIGSGYNGVSNIHHNVITNYGLNHGDVAAFYFAYDNVNTYQKRYYKNLIIDVGNSIETRTNTNEKYAHGIYLDANNYNVIFDSTIVVNANGGYIQNSNDDGDTLTNSKFYNANKQGGNDDWQNVIFVNDELGGNNDNGYISGNVFCTGSESQGGNEQRYILVLDHAPDLEMTLTNNKYFNPFFISTEFCRFMEGYSTVTEYTFSQIQGLGYESGSTYNNTLYDTTLIFINWSDTIRTFKYAAGSSYNEGGSSLPDSIQVAPFYAEIVFINGLDSIVDAGYTYGDGYILLLDSLFGELSSSSTPPKLPSGVSSKHEYHIFTESDYGVSNILSQSFTVGTVGVNEDHYIDSVGAKFGTSDGTVTSIRFDIYAADNDTAIGSILSTGTINSNIPTTPAVVRYVSMSSYKLQASTTYVIVATVTGGSMRWAQYDNGYSGGMDAYKSGSSWVTEPAYDFWFEIYGTTTSSVTTKTATYRGTYSISDYKKRGLSLNPSKRGINYK